MKKRYVIIGNGIAGVSAAQELRRRDDQAEVVIIGDETGFFYSRTALMWIYMNQLNRRDVEPYERWYWQENDLQLIHGRVTAIDRQKRSLTLDQGTELEYHKLLLATGGQPNMFGWPGQQLDGVCNMTSMGHLDRLEALRPRLQRAVVVGGGLIGIEMVEMMLHDKVPVTYLVREPWYWDLSLSEDEARLVEAQLRDHGVDLRLQDEIAEITDDGAGRVKAVQTKQGQDLPCDMVGIAVGVRSDTSLAEQAGLDTGRGITTDGALRTSDPHIYAAGDCAEVHLPADPVQRLLYPDRAPTAPERPLLQKLWYTGQRQGQTAARAMLGDAVIYDPGVNYNSAQFLFMDYVTVGWMKVFRPEVSEWFYNAPGTRDSIRIAHTDDGQVTGMSMLGPRWDAAVMMSWIQQRRQLKWVVEHLDQAVFNEELRANHFAGVRHA